MPYDITNFDSVGHDRCHRVVAKYKVDKWTPILGDPGAVNFHHEHSIVPTIPPKWRACLQANFLGDRLILNVSYAEKNWN